MNDAKAELLAALASIGEAHEFAVFGARPPILPGLRVDGVGEIGLPISPADARALIASSAMAPYGRGEETIADPAVRSVWQIEPERIAFDNPAWSDFVDSLVEEVSAAFAIHRPIRWTLYKLLVYEPGSHFAPHRDSEKADGMFATLVVYLPAKNTGGRLRVRHRGEERSFEPGGAGDAFDLRFAAFYADCEHEIEPLASGYRIALVYNLALARSGKGPSAPEHSGPAAAPGTWGRCTSNRMRSCATRRKCPGMSNRCTRRPASASSARSCHPPIDTRWRNGSPRCASGFGWEACAEALVEMVLAVPAQPARSVDSSALVATVTGLCAAKGPLPEPRRTVCRAVLGALTATLEQLDAQRTVTAWRGGDEPRRRDVIAPIATSLAAVGALDQLGPIIDRALASPSLDDLRDVLVPAAVAIRSERSAALDEAPAVRRLYQHMVDELRAATVAAPQPPTDWRQPVTLRCRCADCLEIEAFANDPESQIHRFKIGKERRRHLHGMIDSAQVDGGRLDMTHVTEHKGNPHTLVCTKTHGAYQRASRRYASDLRALDALGA